MSDIERQIIAVIAKIKPFLQRDGGDIDFYRYEDGVVYVTISGACQDCVLIDNDISDGVEVILREEVPGVIKVVIVNPANEENKEA